MSGLIRRERIVREYGEPPPNIVERGVKKLLDNSREAVTRLDFEHIDAGIRAMESLYYVARAPQQIKVQRRRGCVREA